MFWVFGGQAFRILAPGPGIKPALEGEILPTGAPSHLSSKYPSADPPLCSLARNPHCLIFESEFDLSSLW